MQIRGSARAACAGIAAIAATMTAAVGGAQAADRTVEPLNQYAVSGRVTTDELARAGYDLTEIKSIGNGKLGIVATPAQAAALRDKGAQVQALSQARALSRGSAAESLRLCRARDSTSVARANDAVAAPS